MAECEYHQHDMDDGTRTMWCATHANTQIGVLRDAVWLCSEDVPCTCPAATDIAIQHSPECARYPVGGYPAPVLPGRVAGAGVGSAMMILFDGDGNRRIMIQVGWINSAGRLFSMQMIGNPQVFPNLKPIFVEAPDGNFL